METRDSFTRMATGISEEERQNILNQMKVSEKPSNEPFHPADEKLDENTEPLEVKIKSESVFLS